MQRRWSACKLSYVTQAAFPNLPSTAAAAKITHRGSEISSTLVYSLRVTRMRAWEKTTEELTHCRSLASLSLNSDPPMDLPTQQPGARTTLINCKVPPPHSSRNLSPSQAAPLYTEVTTVPSWLPLVRTDMLGPGQQSIKGRILLLPDQMVPLSLIHHARSYATSG